MLRTLSRPANLRRSARSRGLGGPSKSWRLASAALHARRCQIPFRLARNSVCVPPKFSTLLSVVCIESVANTPAPSQLDTMSSAAPDVHYPCVCPGHEKAVVELQYCSTSGECMLAAALLSTGRAGAWSRAAARAPPVKPRTRATECSWLTRRQNGDQHTVLTGATYSAACTWPF